MDREYVVSTRSKITYYLLFILFSSIVFYLFSIGRSIAHPGPVYLFAIFMMIFPVLLLAGFIRKKIIVSKGIIKCISLFGIEESPVNNIKGYRTVVNKSSKSIVFKFKNGAGKLTLNNITDLADNAELLNWVETNFTNLDAVDMKQERETLLEDISLGATPEERIAALSRAKKLTIAYTVLAAVISFMSIFRDSKLWAIADIIYPFFGVMLIFNSKGLIKFMTDSKRSAYPNILFGIMIISTVCFVQGFISGSIYDSANLWNPAILLAIIIAVAFLFTGMNKSVPAAGQIIFIVLFSSLAGFGNILHINNVFDGSQVQIYRATVIHKSISRGRNTSYYLQTSPWGPEMKSIDVNVGQRMFGDTNIGDTVTLYFEKGALNIPLYRIKRH